jgi:hypothetical protein
VNEKSSFSFRNSLCFALVNVSGRAGALRAPQQDVRSEVSARCQTKAKWRCNLKPNGGVISSDEDDAVQFIAKEPKAELKNEEHPKAGASGQRSTRRATARANVFDEITTSHDHHRHRHREGPQIRSRRRHHAAARARGEQPEKKIIATFG